MPLTQCTNSTKNCFQSKRTSIWRSRAATKLALPRPCCNLCSSSRKSQAAKSLHSRMSKDAAWIATSSDSLARSSFALKKAIVTQTWSRLPSNNTSLNMQTATSTFFLKSLKNFCARENCKSCKLSATLSSRSMATRSETTSRMAAR